MSSLALLSELALLADGALVGAALAFVAFRSLIKYIDASSALNKLRDAPCVPISCLRSLLHQNDDSSSSEVLVVVRGVVDKLPVEKGWFKSVVERLPRDDVLLSSTSGQKGVILRKTQSCIYNGFSGFMPSVSNIRSILAGPWREERSYTRSVPFVLKQGDLQSQSEYLVVNMEGSNHSLPLVTVHHQMQPIISPPYALVHALFGKKYAVGLLDEEQILPPGKEITAVGVCCLKDGVPVIQSCNNLPYFLSEMDKLEMIADLSFRMKVLMWSGIVIGSISVGILGYATARNWKRWKERQQRDRRVREEVHEVEALVEDDEQGEVPEGQLCVLCLRRRRQSAFVPCGHMVCCRRCGLLTERETNPMCPVCAKPVSSSVRIYAT